MLRAETLTERQTQILDGVAAGRSNSIIASDLGITLDGVKWHVSELLGELNLANRRELTEWWVNERRRVSPRSTAMFGLPTLWEWLRNLFSPAAKSGFVLGVAAALAAGVYFIATRGGGSGDNAYVEYIDPSVDPARVAAMPTELTWQWHEIVSSDLQGGYFDQDLVLDVEDGRLVALSTVPRKGSDDMETRFLAWSPSGEATFGITKVDHIVNDEDGVERSDTVETLAIFAGRPEGALQRVAVLRGARVAAAWSPDGDLFVTDHFVIDPLTGTVVGDIDVSGNILSLLWAPDSSHLVVDTVSSGFLLWRRSDGAVGTFRASSPTWSKDSRQLAFVSLAGNSEARLRPVAFDLLTIETRTVREVRQLGAFLSDVQWSPSLSSVAATLLEDDFRKTSTVVLSLDGSNEGVVFSGAKSPIWIDDDRLVLEGDHCGEWDAFIAGTDGSLNPLTDTADEERVSYPSPNGRLLAYERIDRAMWQREAVIVNTSDGEIVGSYGFPVSVNLMTRRSEAWSPNSRHVAFSVSELRRPCEENWTAQETTVEPFE